MIKACIFDTKKQCNDCGECNKCDINPSKTCNSCGKCLDIEGYDAKAIGIEEIVEESSTPCIQEEKQTKLDPENLLEKFSRHNINLNEEEVEVEYIDDIDGLNDILENETSSNSMKELFPGFYVLDKNSEE